MIQRLLTFLRPTAYAWHVDVGLLLLRVGVSAMMMTHGWPKLAGFSERAGRFYDFMGIGSEWSLVLAVFAEFFCSIFLLIGLGVRVVLVPLIILTLVIAFMVHADDPYKEKEHALLFLVPYLVLMLTHSGRYALDYLIFNRKKEV